MRVVSVGVDFSRNRRDSGGTALHDPARHVHRLQDEEGGRGQLLSQ